VIFFFWLGPYVTFFRAIICRYLAQILKSVYPTKEAGHIMQPISGLGPITLAYQEQKDYGVLGSKKTCSAELCTIAAECVPLISPPPPVLQPLYTGDVWQDMHD
jgi:hypothetical protein